MHIDVHDACSWIDQKQLWPTSCVIWDVNYGFRALFVTSVVQLQMQNYNLDNELKAQRQVSAKLKEEVHMYRAELDKLLCDKTSLLTLTGNNVSTCALV